MPSGTNVPSASDRPSNEPSMTEVKGAFRDREDVERAVYRLGQESVPSDSIRVYVTDTEGGSTRELDVEEEAGTLQGALVGAALGTLIGLLVVALVPTGALGAAPAELFEASTLSFAVTVVAILAVGGLPLGAIVGMGHWRIGERISEHELRGGNVWVAVRSDELADVARRILQESGADRVTP